MEYTKEMIAKARKHLEEREINPDVVRPPRPIGNPRIHERHDKSVKLDTLGSPVGRATLATLTDRVEERAIQLVDLADASPDDVGLQNHAREISEIATQLMRLSKSLRQHQFKHNGRGREMNLQLPGNGRVMVYHDIEDDVRWVRVIGVASWGPYVNADEAYEKGHAYAEILSKWATHGKQAKEVKKVLDQQKEEEERITAMTDTARRFRFEHLSREDSKQSET